MRRSGFVRALAAGAGVAYALPARAQTALKLSIGVNAADDVTPLLWGKASGMFARAGLDVDIQKFTSGSIAVAAVIGGSLDAARTSLLPLINARNRGIPLLLIAPGDLALPSDPTSAIVTGNNSPIANGKQLNGATLPVPALHDFNELVTRAWVDATGGDSKTLRFIEAPMATIVPAIESGRVPAGMVTEPFLTDVLAAGRVKLIGRPTQAIAQRYLITGYVALEPFISAHREALAAFAQSLEAAGAYTATHHAETVAAVAPFWGMNAAVIGAMPATHTAPSLDPKDIQPLIDAAARYGVIPKPFPAETLIAPTRIR